MVKTETPKVNRPPAPTALKDKALSTSRPRELRRGSNDSRQGMVGANSPRKVSWDEV